MLLVRLQIDYIDLLTLKAYKLFEISDADLSWLLFFKEANLSKYLAILSHARTEFTRWFT